MAEAVDFADGSDQDRGDRELTPADEAREVEEASEVYPPYHPFA